MVVVTVGVIVVAVGDIVEVMLLVGVVTPDDGSSVASAHTSIADGCVSFARFSSVVFVSTRGTDGAIDGLELGSDDLSVPNGFVVVVVVVDDDAVVVVVFVVVVVVVVSRKSDDIVDTVGNDVHNELDVKGSDWPVVVAVSCTGGDVDDALEFIELFVVIVVDVADDVVEFAARSRPPVFCCCSR